MSDPRDSLAAAAFGLACSVSYVAQRLATLLGPQIPSDLVLEQAHIPYSWRVGLALFHGLIVALVLRFGPTPERARAWLPRLSAAALPLVLLLAALALAVP